MNKKTKRICELQIGDGFVAWGVLRKVIQIDDTYLHYATFDKSGRFYQNKNKRSDTFYKNSKLIVEVTDINQAKETIKEHIKWAAIYDNIPTYKYGD